VPGSKGNRGQREEREEREERGSEAPEGMPATTAVAVEGVAVVEPKPGASGSGPVGDSEARREALARKAWLAVNELARTNPLAFDVIAGLVVAAVVGTLILGALAPQLLANRQAERQRLAEESRAERELRLEIARQRRETLRRFTDGIPRNQDIAVRIVALRIWVEEVYDEAVLKAGDVSLMPIDGKGDNLKEVIDQIDELRKDWYESEEEHYLALCETAAVQFGSDRQSMRESVQVISELFDALYGLRTHPTPRRACERVAQTFERIEEIVASNAFRRICPSLTILKASVEVIDDEEGEKGFKVIVTPQPWKSAASSSEKSWDEESEPEVSDVSPSQSSIAFDARHSRLTSHWADKLWWARRNAAVHLNNEDPYEAAGELLEEIDLAISLAYLDAIASMAAELEEDAKEFVTRK